MNAGELITELERLRTGSAVLTFDADGTLWSGDVGEDGFHRALAEGLLREDALPAMCEIAARFSLSIEGTVHDVALRLWTAYTEGRFPEREMCEVMTWCYAGWSVADFATYGDTVVSEARLESRLHRELEPIIQWARSTALGTMVVSASPRGLVEAGARLWGFAREDVIAATPDARDGRIATRLIGPVPYAKSKCDLASERIADRQWLASFGDNVFDIDMLGAARVGVAVRPKPALRKRLPELPEIVLLGS
jgi:phosphatidylglycerophosphatase C